MTVSQTVTQAGQETLHHPEELNDAIDAATPGGIDPTKTLAAQVKRIKWQTFSATESCLLVLTYTMCVILNVTVGFTDTRQIPKQNLGLFMFCRGLVPDEVERGIARVSHSLPTGSHS